MKSVKWQALLGVVVSGLMVAVGSVKAETPPAQQMYPQIVRLSYVEGDVRVSRGQAGEKATRDEWEKAAVDVPLYSGFTLVTGADGRAEIELEDASHLYLGENSVLSFVELRANGNVRMTSLDLVSGVMTIDAQTAQPGGTSVMIVKTPANGFWLRTPWKSFIRVNSYLDGMELTPLVNRTKINTPAGLTSSNAGQTMVFAAGQKTPQIMPQTGPNAYAAWDDWVRARSAAHMQAINAAMKDAGLTSPVPGLTEIAAQGSFFDCAPYGKCWEPKEGWNPSGAGDGAGAQAAPAAATSTQTANAAAANASHPNSQTGPDPCSVADSSQCVIEDDYFPCSPYAMRDFYERDPVTGRLKLIFSDDEATGLKPYWYGQPYLWGVCHTGSWVHWHKRYVWVSGTHRHHRWGVRWVKVNGKTGFVPVHPRDVTGKPPLNIKHGVYIATGKKEHGAELMHVSDPVKVLDGTPKEYAKLTFEPLPRAEAPHMEARKLHDVGDHHGDGASKPAVLTFDNKSHSFEVAHTVIEGGHEHQVSEPVGGRGNGIGMGRGDSSANHGGSQNGGFNSGGGNRSDSGAGSRSFSGASEGAHASAPSSGASSGASRGSSGGAHH